MDKRHLCIKLINPNFSDDYIQIRLITLKTDEIIDNLLNLRTYSKDDFEKWNNISNGRINSILEDFEKDIKTVCSIMRNMVHYDITSEEEDKNFLGYLNKAVGLNTKFHTRTTNNIVANYLKPIRFEIINFLQINNIKPYSDLEMIINLIYKLMTDKK
ncbi:MULTISPECIES: hypothetical protein [Bacillus]|uniref:hypothetical protein n=1 Tax=Bacillus TaxID=1386 RepID=UPI001BCBD0F5|nr:MULTISPECIES: hypothetical protein [Bacillus]MBS4746195.1 hypothetical protein [Bacillus altitudinis]